MVKLVILLVCAGMMGAQAPDPPDPKLDTAIAAPIAPVKQESRDDNHILGVVPNYTAVNQPARVYNPITVSQKFALAAHDSFDPFNWLITGVYAGVYQMRNTYPEFKQGATGYAKRYGATFADGAISTYLTEGVLPSLLHEDPRFFRMG